MVSKLVILEESEAKYVAPDNRPVWFSQLIDLAGRGGGGKCTQVLVIRTRQCV